MIVADTNLVAYLLIEGERTDTARKVWAKDSQWKLPTLWRSDDPAGAVCGVRF